MTVTLYASTDGSVSADDMVVKTFTWSHLSLKSGSSRTLKLKFTYPAGLADGSYDLVASVDATATSTAAATAASTPVNIAAPKVDLAAGAPAGESVLVTAGKNASVTIAITNAGNVAAIGNLSVNLYASSDATLDDSDQILTNFGAIKINLRPGKAKTLHLHFKAPLNLPAGTFNLLGAITAFTNPADSNPSNDTAVVPVTSA